MKNLQFSQTNHLELIAPTKFSLHSLGNGDVQSTIQTPYPAHDKYAGANFTLIL